MGSLDGVMDQSIAGTRIGDYIVVHEDSHGYTATHVLLPRRVRLDVMHPTLGGVQPAAVRMMREACILEALQHPAVPRVYEVGLLVDDHVQRPWIARELVEGEALDAIVREGTAVGPTDVLEILGEVADVLAYAHARNVAHRGVRPDAIVRAEPGSRRSSVRLVNWTEARVADSLDDADRAFADDVFALGLVADLVITCRADMPSALVALVDDMLVPDPKSRPSAADVVSRVQHILRSLDATPIEVDDDPVMEVDDADLEPVSVAFVAPPASWTPPIGVRHARGSTPPAVPIAVIAKRPMLDS